MEAKAPKGCEAEVGLEFPNAAVELLSLGIVLRAARLIRPSENLGSPRVSLL